MVLKVESIGYPWGAQRSDKRWRVVLKRRTRVLVYVLIFVLETKVCFLMISHPTSILKTTKKKKARITKSAFKKCNYLLYIKNKNKAQERLKSKSGTRHKRQI